MRSVPALLSSLACSLVLSSAAAAQDVPPTPKPGPEHEIFKMEEGTWDAVIELSPPGAPVMTSKGTEVAMVGCNGLCLITDFKGDMMPGMPFQGHGISTYDGAKKKYVGSWTDSMSPGISMSEGTYDPATKVMTSWMEGPDATGVVQKTKATVAYSDADHRTMTMFLKAPDGTEMQMMKISYTRRK
jgi:Protein of unknown function (DUF1579)